MRFLTRDEILGVDDLDFEDVSVPEWGTDCGVRIRTGGAEDRDDFDKSILLRKGKNLEVNTKLMRVKLLARSIVDPETNKPVFTEADLERLAKKNARAIVRLYDVAARLWGITKEDVEVLTGESKPGPNLEPGTATPGNGATPIHVTSGAS